MITIYANWSGNSLTRGETLVDARAKLTMADCAPGTMFGDGPAELTALDTGPHDTIRPGREKLDALQVAKEFFSKVSS